MEKAEKADRGKIFAWIAAICCVVILAPGFLSRLSQDFGVVRSLFLWMDWEIIWIFLAAALLIRNKTFVAIAIGVKVCNTVSSAYWYALFRSGNVALIGWSDILCLLAYTVLTAIFIVSYKKKSAITYAITYIWFIPAILFLFSTALKYYYYVLDGLIIHTIASFFSFCDYYLYPLIELAILIFIGLWLKHYEQSSPSIASQALIHESSQRADNLIGSAEKLKTYKELLDSGVITQEEFDQKKKQILGL